MTNFHTSQQIIEQIPGSLLSRAGIPPRLSVSRTKRMFIDVVKHVQSSLTADSYIAKPRWALMTCEELNIKVANEAINKICDLLVYKYQTPHYQTAMTPSHVENTAQTSGPKN
jgi:hypothetical protein